MYNIILIMPLFHETSKKIIIKVIVCNDIYEALNFFYLTLEKPFDIL